jgi:hypothetical protein
MNRTSGGVRKIEVAWTALQNGIMSMIHRSTRGTVVAPRYRIAIFGYNSRVHDLLGGIKPISELTHQLPNPILDYGAQTASAFAFVEQVLKAELPKLQHCPAPLVCHLTDGMYAGADPEPVVARIRKAAVQDGNVLVENIFVSRSILKQAIVNPQTWRGVGDEQQILEDRKYARKLLAMSSMIPDSYLANLREFGYQLQPGAHMLMPGDTPELLRLGFVMSGATPTTR